MPILHLVVLIAMMHFIADFICTSNYISSNKGKSVAVLGIHIGLYTLACFALLALLQLGYSPFVSFEDICFYAVINGLFHFLTDFVTSKITTKCWTKKNYRLFFLTIGLDQFIHTMTLILTLKLML